jgi:hypothetical protein
MKKALLVLLLLTLTGLPLLAADPANVAGKWKMTMTTPRGERVTEYTITQDKDKISLTWIGGRENQEQKAEGTVTGNDIQWSFSRETPNGTFSMTYKGTVTGDTMKGTVEGPMGVVDWKGERVKS